MFFLSTCFEMLFFFYFSFFCLYCRKNQIPTNRQRSLLRSLLLSPPSVCWLAARRRLRPHFDLCSMSFPLYFPYISDTKPSFVFTYKNSYLRFPSRIRYRSCLRSCWRLYGLSFLLSENKIVYIVHIYRT
jgi:hypothetical protein